MIVTILSIVSVVCWLAVFFVGAPSLIEPQFPDREAERVLARHRRADYERMLRETAELERKLGIHRTDEEY
jgi:hypothetical protein